MPAAGYVTPAEFIGFYDPRRVCELLSVTGTPVSVGDLSDDESDGYLSLLNYFILPVSAEIDAACQVGRRYTRADLEAIISEATASDPDTDANYSAKQKRAAYLRRLCADLVFGQLTANRGYSSVDALKRMAPRYEIAQGVLEQLYQGARVFDIETAIAAGVPQVTTIGTKNLNSSQFNRLFGIWPDTYPPYSTPFGFYGGYYGYY